jgi:hypothetical protein
MILSTKGVGIEFSLTNQTADFGSIMSDRYGRFRMRYGLLTKLAVAGMGLAALGVVGCGERRERVVYSEGTSSDGAVVEEETVVDEPPPPQVEVVGVAPWPGAFWIRGHYYRDHGRWAWRRGSWEHRPHAGAMWHEGRWDHRGHGYVWIGGYWR